MSKIQKLLLFLFTIDTIMMIIAVTQKDIIGLVHAGIASINIMLFYTCDKIVEAIKGSK